MLDASEGPRRILLVEDEPLIQMLATDFLEDVGFKVDTAGTAREALNKLALGLWRIRSCYRRYRITGSKRR